MDLGSKRQTVKLRGDAIAALQTNSLIVGLVITRAVQGLPGRHTSASKLFARPESRQTGSHRCEAVAVPAARERRRQC